MVDSWIYDEGQRRLLTTAGGAALVQGQPSARPEKEKGKEAGVLPD